MGPPKFQACYLGSPNRAEVYPASRAYSPVVGR